MAEIETLEYGLHSGTEYAVLWIIKKNLFAPSILNLLIALTLPK
jgi:hypothetical protein